MAVRTIAFPSRFESHELNGLAAYVESFDGIVLSQATPNDSHPTNGRCDRRTANGLSTWLIDLPDQRLIAFNNALIDCLDELSLIDAHKPLNPLDHLF